MCWYENKRHIKEKIAIYNSKESDESDDVEKASEAGDSLHAR